MIAMIAWPARGALTALVLISLATPAAAEQTSLRRFALIAGSNDGGPGRVRLRYAATDAFAFAKVLEELGGVPSADTILLLDPTREELEIGIDLLQRRLEEAAGPYRRLEALVYYSGHSDEQGLLLGADLLPYKAFRERLDRLNADVRIAVLDSCASGALTRAKGGRRHAPFMIDVSQRVKGHAFLTSASATEAAQESDRVGGSFFTHYLVSGLRGAADVTGDRRVTLTEAYQFAFNETLARTENTQSGPQHPNYDIQLAGSGDVVMTDLHQTSAALLLPAGLRGRLFVRDDAGRLVAELFKASGRPVELGLEPGQYLVTVDDGGNLHRAVVSLRQGERVELTDLEIVTVEREAVVLRGRTRSWVRERMEFEDLDFEAESEPEAAEPERAPAVEPRGGLLGPEAHLDADAYTDVLFSVAVIPGVGTAFYQPGKLRKRWSLNILYGRTDLVRGAEIGLVNGTLDGVIGVQIGVANLNGGFLHGAQLGNPVNVTLGGGYGAQLTSGVNIMSGRFIGTQIAAAGNIMRSTNPTAAQLSLGFNFATGGLRGTQISSGFNFLGGKGNGVMQATAGANVATDRLTGAQLSAGVNYAYELHGLQTNAGLNLANSFNGAQLGLINISGDMTGAQLGVVNLALGSVSGMQLGILNIAGEYDTGIPFGLLNFVKDGQFHFDIWASDVFFFNTSLKLGSKNVYTILTAAMSPDEGPDRRTRMALGLGMGGTINVTEDFFFAFDAMFFEADMTVPRVEKVRLFHSNTAEHLTQARLMIGYKFHEHFGLFAGASGNIYIGHNGRDQEVPSRFGRDMQQVEFVEDARLTVRAWPGFFAGVQI